MSKFIDMAGFKSGRLTVLARAANSACGDAMWACVCECGADFIARGVNLRKGIARSCGCWMRERMAESATTHGYSGRGRKHPLYAIRGGMIRRCHNPRSKFFYCYGERGISVCPDWRRDPVMFIEWAIANGWRPGLSIDRIDNDGNYEPSNCRFITRRENAMKRSPKETWRKVNKSGGFNRAKTICPKGHPLDGVQVRKDRTMRFCYTCRREQSRDGKARQRLNRTLTK